MYQSIYFSIYIHADKQTDQKHTCLEKYITLRYAKHSMHTIIPLGAGADDDGSLPCMHGWLGL